MAASLTTVASKHAAMKERAAIQKTVDAEVDKMVKLHVEGELDRSPGCFSRLVSCPGFGTRFRRMAVPTVESASVSSSAAASASLGSKSGSLMTRLVGNSKQNEAVRIETAMKTVQARVSLLSEKVTVSRQRALDSKRASKNEEAMRELRKSKAVEKQLATATAALEALERQEDMLAQSSLQRELAAALSTTNKEVKKKHKGLLSFAEKAVDESVELKDDAEDIGSVFDGLVGAVDPGVDEDELLQELESMVEDDVSSTTPNNPVRVEAILSDVADDSSSAYAAFPSAPQAETIANSGVRCGLLASAAT